MDRRLVLRAIPGLALWGAASAAAAQSDPFSSLLRQLETNPELVESAWALREQQTTRGVGHGTPSSRRLPADAVDMIVRLEVSSPRRYEHSYRRPIWPGGQSGVTIGIGYDLRFASEADLERDWSQLLGADTLNTLRPALGLGREAAREALPSVQSVDIPWTLAYSQFTAFLPYPTKDTENAFPNCSELDDDSFGALVSLVYNRGAAMPANSNRRREMREIRDLMSQRNFAPIPDKIREMKRLWTDPGARGLVIRRELEALLFERGLTKSA